MSRMIYCANCRNTGFSDWRLGSSEKPCRRCGHGRFVSLPSVKSQPDQISELHTKIADLEARVEAWERLAERNEWKPTFKEANDETL